MGAAGTSRCPMCKEGIPRLIQSPVREEDLADAAATEKTRRMARSTLVILITMATLIIFFVTLLAVLTYKPSSRP